jgi:predicted transcriptional regulator of viral defense system
MKSPAKPTTMETLILKSIAARRHASTFCGKDFSHLGSPSAIRKALERLTRQGSLRRIRQGFYDRPRPHPILGQTPTVPMDLIQSMMGKSHAKWQVSGAYAANLLHLSDQVPSRIVILTDIAPRKIQLGKLTLDFRRAAPRNLLAAGTTAGLVFQALRHLKQDNLTSDIITRLKTELNADAKASIQKITTSTPAWMHPYLNQITATP